MTYPLVQLVDAPTSAATVLFDFNDVSLTPKREVHAEEFTIGVPELIGDVDAIEPLWGERMVSFTCSLTGTKPQVAAVQTTLARRLLAPGQGWLRVRMTATSRLLFFRTCRPQPGDLSFDEVYTTSTTKAERWDIKVDLPCEPFAFGERVTQAAATVTSNPTSGTNPMRLVLPAVTGDAPTPLDLIIGFSTASSAPASVTIMAHSSIAAHSTIHLPIGTSDGASVGLDMTVGSSSAYVGGSYREVSFATTPGLSTRVVPPNATSMVPGRYRALLRVSSTVAGTVFRAALDGASMARTTTVTFSPSSTGGTWVDFGVINVPTQPARSPNGPFQDTSHSIGAITAGRVSGTGALRLDHLMFIPVGVGDGLDSRSVRVTSEGPLADALLYVDGTYEEVTSNSGALGAIEIEGTFPRATPGAVNALSFTFASAPYATDDISRTASVTVSWYPRFLYLGDF